MNFNESFCFSLLISVNSSSTPAFFPMMSGNFFHRNVDFFDETSEVRHNDGEVARQMGSLVAMMNASARGKLKICRLKQVLKESL